MCVCRSFLFLSKEGDKMKLDLNQAAGEARCVGEVCGGGVDTSGVVPLHSSHNLTCTQTCIHTDTDSKKHLIF